MFIDSLSNKLDISHSRLININFDSENKKIYFTLGSRKKNTNELLTSEVINILNNLIEKKGVKIFNRDKTNHIIELSDIL